MAAIMREPKVIKPLAQHTATVIFLHGLGDTGNGWVPAVQMIRQCRQRLSHVKFILPHAPAIRISFNYGMMMPGWYDIKVLDGTPEALRESEDQPGLLRSREHLRNLIASEMATTGIPSERILLAGFSQGGAMALLTGLTLTSRLAGILGLSCYVPLTAQFAEIMPPTENNRETPIWMGHGDADNVVNVKLGKDSQRFLKEKGYNASLKIYKDVTHSACNEELEDVEAFIYQQLPSLDKDKAVGK